MSLFISETEKLFASQFQEQGYVIQSVENSDQFEQIRKLVANAAANYLECSFSDEETFLNQIHQQVSLVQLNDLRLEVIRQINDEPWFRNFYFQLARPALEALVGNELAMQLRVNLSIQFPQDDRSLLPVHADVWSGDSPYEVVVWLPLVNCYKTKAMYLMPPAADQRLRENFSQNAARSSEELFRRIEKEVTWIDINAGQVLIFNQNLPHGNRINEETETRWSMNCRFKGVFTPYGDKKIGEFFEPITLKAASRVGMSYRFPQFPTKSD